MIRMGTYNILGGTQDFKGTAAVIRRLEREFRKEYPHRFFSGSLGLLSRLPMREPRYEKSEKGGNGFLFAEVKHGQGWIQVANLHLEPLRAWSPKEKLLLPLQIHRQSTVQDAEITQAFKALKTGRPTLIAGDFNRVNDSTIKRLKASGYTDSFAAVTPEADKVHTLRFKVLGMHSGKRIDFVFHDAGFQTVESRVLPGLPSDHEALWSSMRRKPVERR